MPVAPNPLDRNLIDRAFPTGVRAIVRPHELVDEPGARSQPVGMLELRKLCSSSTVSIRPAGISVAGISADRTGLPSLPKVTK